MNRKPPLSVFLSMFLLLMLTFCSGMPVRAVASWNVQTVDVNGEGFAASCPIVIDSKNNPHIAYTGLIGNRNLVIYADWGSSGWSTRTVDVGRLFDFTLDSKGTPHILYGYGPGGLRYASWTGSNWNIQTVDEAFLGRGAGSIALDSSGKPHIAYLDYLKVLKYASWLGSSWGIEILDSAEEFWPVLSLEFGPNSIPYILYGFYNIENSTKTIKMAVRENSSWNIQPVVSNWINYGNMVLDSEGHPSFFYLINSQEPGDIDHSIVKHASWNDSAWNIQSVALDTIGYLALDAHDDPSIAYIQSYEKVIYASWTGTAWKIQTVDTNLTAIAGCNLAVDTHGNPHISYLAKPPEATIPSHILYVMYATAAASEFAPSVKILSPVNELYDTSNIPLEFMIDEPASQISYSIDGQENVTIIGNTTLTGLPSGYHNITVYATDEIGNTGKSETICFTIEVPEPQHIPITLVIASIITAVVIGVGMLLYFKKRKH